METEIEIHIGNTRFSYQYTIGDRYDWRPKASFQNGGRPENGIIDADEFTRCPEYGDNTPVKVTIQNDIITDVYFDPDRNINDNIPSPQIPIEYVDSYPHGVKYRVKKQDDE